MIRAYQQFNQGGNFAWCWPKKWCSNYFCITFAAGWSCLKNHVRATCITNDVFPGLSFGNSFVGEGFSQLFKCRLLQSVERASEYGLFRNMYFWCTILFSTDIPASYHANYHGSISVNCVEIICFCFSYHLIWKVYTGQQRYKIQFTSDWTIQTANLISYSAIFK